MKERNPKRNISEDTTLSERDRNNDIQNLQHPLSAMFSEVWEHHSVRSLRGKIAKEKYPLFEDDDLQQEAFLHSWVEMVTKKRAVRWNLKGYLFRIVVNRLHDILGEVVRRKRQEKEKVFLSEVMGEDYESRRWKPASVPPEMWVFDPVESKLLAMSLIAGMECLGEPKADEIDDRRRKVLSDVIALSGAVGEPINSLIQQYRDLDNRSEYRAASKIHGLSKKRQEILLTELRALFQRHGLHGRHIHRSVQSRAVPMFLPTYVETDFDRIQRMRRLPFWSSRSPDEMLEEVARHNRRLLSKESDELQVSLSLAKSWRVDHG
jgi:DNA-directed RNA polymerase specialized sigma24 family protein